MKINIIINSDIELFSREEILSAELSNIPFSNSFSFGKNTVKDVISNENKSYIFIEDNCFYWSNETWEKFLNNIKNLVYQIIIPAGNHLAKKSQIQHPFYLTLSDLKKINQIRDEQNFTIIPEENDFKPIFAISTSLLKKLPENTKLASIKNLLTNNEVEVFNKGWLHYFNYDANYDERSDLFNIENIFGDVLEIGCFKGKMAKVGKKLNSCKWTGIDIHFNNLKEAKNYVDFPLIAAISDKLPIKKSKKFDFIICADFIEHIPYPWDLLKDFNNHIKDNGKLIISVPNIGHWSIIRDLLQGKFDETPSGTLCVTHLRHGTLKNWKKWIENSGWTIDKMVREKISFNEEFNKLLEYSDINHDIDNLETYRFKFVASKKS